LGLALGGAAPEKRCHYRGGPTGLGAAIMLAKRGWTDITVLEKRPAADYYEPDKSFNYQIDGCGQKLTDFLELTTKLADLSVPNRLVRNINKVSKTW